MFLFSCTICLTYLRVKHAIATSYTNIQTLSRFQVDPFTSITAIERYLLDRGIGYVRGEESSGDDDGSDDDEMPSVSFCEFFSSSFNSVVTSFNTI